MIRLITALILLLASIFAWGSHVALDNGDSSEKAEPLPEPKVSRPASARVAPADLMGNNGSAFFPIGLWIEGANQDTGHMGAAPVDPNDAVKYYDEIFRQIRSFGINVSPDPNVDLAHAPKLIAAAESAGLYLIHESPPIHAISGNTANCYSVTDSQAATAVQQALRSCVGGANPGATCTSNANCFGGVCVSFADSPALAAFQIRDEPTESCLPALRALNKNLGIYDSSYTGSSALSILKAAGTCSVSGAPCPTGYSAHCPSGETCISPELFDRLSMMDKVLAYDQVTMDDIYPLWGYLPDHYGTPIGDPTALEDWNGRLDLHYLKTPVDKPLHQVIQAHRSLTFARDPTPVELRYMTYSALARGVKGIYWFLYPEEVRGPDGDLDGIPDALGEGGVADFDFNINNNGREIQRLAPELRALAPWLIDASRDYGLKNGRIPAAEVDNATPNEYDITTFQTRFSEKLIMLINESMKPGHCSTATTVVCTAIDSVWRCPAGDTCMGADPAFKTFHVRINKNNPHVAPVLAKGPVKINEVLSGVSFAPTPNGDYLEFNLTLKQGDGKLLQLQSANSAEIRITRDAYNNPVKSGKSLNVTVSLKNIGTNTWTTSGFHAGVHVTTPTGAYIPQAVDVVGQNFVQNVPPGQSATLKLTIPTGPGKSLDMEGTYTLGIDLFQDGTPLHWFKNEQQISVMVLSNPLLVDTFDSVPYNRPADFLWKWDRTAFMTIRDDRLAINGQNVALSHWGSTWTNNYTFEFDVKIDEESPPDSSYAGWVFLASSSTNGYMFQLAANDAPNNPNSIRKHTQTNGSFVGATPIGSYCVGGTNPHASCTSNANCTGGGICTPLTINRGTWYHVKEELLSSPPTIKTWINGNLVDTWVDGTHTSGRVGFRLFEEAYPPAPPPLCGSNRCCGEACYPGLERAHFDNVSVYVPGAAQAYTPPQVTGVNVSATTDKLLVRWNHMQSADVDKVSHYRVYRGNTPTFTPSPGNLRGEPAGTAFTDGPPNFVPGTTYHYKVTAVSHADTEGAASAVASGVSIALPSAVTNLSTVVDNMKSITLSWSNGGGAAKYNVHRGLPGFTPTPDNRIGTVTALTFRDNNTNTFVSDSQFGLRSFTSYQYAVVSVSSSGGIGPAVLTSASSPPTTPGSKIFSDGFDGTATQWQQLTGSWSISSSAFNQTNTAAAGVASIIGKRFANLSAEFTVQITSNPNDPQNINWAGMTIRKNNQSDKFGGTYSGYLIYYRANGEVQIYNPVDGIIPLASAETGLSPKDAPRRVRIDATGSNLKVFVEGIKFIDWTDPNARFSAGFVDLTTFGVAASFRDVNVFFRDAFTSVNLMTCGSSCNQMPGWSFVGAGVFDASAIGQLKFSAPAGVAYALSPNELKVVDFVADYSVRIDNHNGNATRWAAFAFRKTHQSDSHFTSGYMVYYRANGQLALYGAGMGDLQTKMTAVTPYGAYQHLRVWAQGNRIRVFLNGTTVPEIDYTDVTSRYSQGFVHLTASETTARFEFLQIY